MSQTAGISATSRDTGRLGDLMSRALPPIVAGLIIVALWQFLVRIFHVQTFLLPAPTDIATAFGNDAGVILSATRRTGIAVLLGLAIGITSGVGLALFLSYARSLAGPILTFAVAANSAPIIALAPISNNWFGITSTMSKAAVAGIMVFFPIMVNTTRGLMALKNSEAELLHSYAASRWQVTRFVRLPTALPYFFSALKLGSTLAVIGVIVTEYFGGPTDALGVYIANKAALPKFASAWAGVIVASAMGLVLFGTVSLIERVAMPWHSSVRRSQ